MHWGPIYRNGGSKLLSDFLVCIFSYAQDSWMAQWVIFLETDFGITQSVFYYTFDSLELTTLYINETESWWSHLAISEDNLCTWKKIQMRSLRFEGFGGQMNFRGYSMFGSYIIASSQDNLCQSSHSDIKTNCTAKSNTEVEWPNKRVRTWLI